MEKKKYRKVKIAFCFDDVWGGGLSVYLYNLIDKIDKDTFEVCVICNDIIESNYNLILKKIKASGIEVISFERGKFIPSFYFLWRIFLKKKLDAISLHSWHHKFILAAKFAGVPIVVFHPHSDYPIRSNYNIRHKIIDLLARSLLDKMVVPSQRNIPLLKKIYQIPEYKIIVIPYGINVRFFTAESDKIQHREKLGFDQKSILVGNVARIDEIKGQYYLLEAIGILKNRGLSLLLLLIGAASMFTLDYERRLKLLVNKLNLEKNVIFLGFREDIKDILGVIDIYVSASLVEVFPLAILEAMAMSRPTVATDVGGVSDLIINKETSLLVSPAESQGLAEAIAWFIQNPDEAVIMGTMARKQVEQSYSIEAAVHKTEELYIDLLRNRRRI